MSHCLDRRTVLTGAGAALVAPIPALAAASGTRTFRVLRAGSDIGYHRISATRDGDSVRARTEIEIAVKFLGITAYRYELQYDEIYRDGLLQSFDAISNDDGDRGYAKAQRNGAFLEIDGSGYSGAAPGEVVPTSYWRQPGLGATPWISAQDGELLPVSTSEIGPLPQTPAGSRVWRATDQANYLVDIWYDSVGDWTGCSFDASGELGVYTLVPGSDSLVQLAT